MLRKVFLHGGILLLAEAVVFAAPGSGWAQHGGGHGGGGHGGGGHFGGGGFGGGHFGGGHFGGGHFVGSDGGFRHGGYGYNHYYPFYGGYGYGYYPSYGYGYYPSYGYDYYPYSSSGVPSDSGYDGSYGGQALSYPDDYASVTPPAAGYQSYYPPVTGTPEPDRLAHVTVRVPADAQVWFQAAPTTSTGPVRQFDSPPLTSGGSYTYEIRARWNENGQEVTQTQQVGVTAGAHVNVNFPAAPNAAGQGSAAKKG